MYHRIAPELFDKILDELYPIRLGLVDEKGWNIDSQYEELLQILENNVVQSNTCGKNIADTFFLEISKVKSKLDLDIQAIFDGDPAAKSTTEITLTYPGFYAIAAYRIANLLHNLGVDLIPRAITEHAHSKTGIDIHPSATIGDRFFIDHGTGIVIGETTVIGNNVKLYQGVTLGALSLNNTDLTKQRHPTIEDNVVLYAQATILGGKTTIGTNSIIGGNVWLTASVPPNSKVFYTPQIESRKNSISKSTEQIEQ